MLKVIPNGANRIDMELSGKLTREEMQGALDEWMKLSEGVVHGRMLYELFDFHLPTLGAIREEFSRMPALLKTMKQFERAAVVADQAWIRKISEWEGALFPGLEIKAFKREERLEAEAWLAHNTP